MTTYTQARAALNEISQRSEANRKRIDSAVALVTTAVNDLGAMPTDYSAIVTVINDGAANNPLDPSWQELKAAKDNMVTDFQSLKSDAESKQTALAG